MKYIVRFYDCFDGWIDIQKFETKEEAQTYADEKNRTLPESNKRMLEKYSVFPSDTTMLYTPESLGR